MLKNAVLSLVVVGLWVVPLHAQPMTFGELYPDYALLTQHFAVQEDGITWTGPTTHSAQRRIVDDFWRLVVDMGAYSFYFRTHQLAVEGLPPEQGIHLRRIGVLDRTIVCASDKPLARPARALLEALGCQVVDMHVWQEYPGAQLCNAKETP